MVAIHTRALLYGLATAYTATAAVLPWSTVNPKPAAELKSHGHVATVNVHAPCLAKHSHGSVNQSPCEKKQHHQHHQHHQHSDIAVCVGSKKCNQPHSKRDVIAARQVDPQPSQTTVITLTLTQSTPTPSSTQTPTPSSTQAPSSSSTQDPPPVIIEFTSFSSTEPTSSSSTEPRPSAQAVITTVTVKRPARPSSTNPPISQADPPEAKWQLASSHTTKAPQPSSSTTKSASLSTRSEEEEDGSPHFRMVTLDQEESSSSSPTTKAPRPTSSTAKSPSLSTRSEDEESEESDGDGSPHFRMVTLDQTESSSSTARSYYTTTITRQPSSSSYSTTTPAQSSSRVPVIVVPLESPTLTYQRRSIGTGEPNSWQPSGSSSLTSQEDQRGSNSTAPHSEPPPATSPKLSQGVSNHTEPPQNGLKDIYVGHEMMYRRPDRTHAPSKPGIPQLSHGHPWRGYPSRNRTGSEHYQEQNQRPEHHQGQYLRSKHYQEQEQRPGSEQGPGQQSEQQGPGQQSAQGPGQQSEQQRPGQQSSQGTGQQSAQGTGQQSAQRPSQQSEQQVPGQQSEQQGPGQQSEQQGPGQQSSQGTGKQSAQGTGAQGTGQQSEQRPGQQSAQCTGQQSEQQRPGQQSEKQGTAQQSEQQGTAQQSAQGAGQQSEQQRPGQQSAQGTGAQGTGQQSAQGTWQQSEQKSNQRPEQESNQRPEGNTAQRPNQGSNQRPEQESNQRPEQNAGQRSAQRPEQRPEEGYGRKPQQGPWQKPKQRPEQKSEQKSGQERKPKPANSQDGKSPKDCKEELKQAGELWRLRTHVVRGAGSSSFEDLYVQEPEGVSNSVPKLRHRRKTAGEFSYDGPTSTVALWHDKCTFSGLTMHGDNDVDGYSPAFLGESIGTKRMKADWNSLSWDNDRFAGWVVCKGKTRKREYTLEWHDAIGNQGIDEERCAVVELLMEPIAKDEKE